MNPNSFKAKYNLDVRTNSGVIRINRAEKTITVRNVVDIERLQKAIVEKNAQNIAVIGGGYIGVEVAENLRLVGRNVTLIQGAPQILRPFYFRSTGPTYIL